MQVANASLKFICMVQAGMQGMFKNHFSPPHCGGKKTQAGVTADTAVKVQKKQICLATLTSVEVKPPRFMHVKALYNAQNHAVQHDVRHAQCHKQDP
jgi:hypothetical protein